MHPRTLVVPLCLALVACGEEEDLSDVKSRLAAVEAALAEDPGTGDVAALQAEVDAAVARLDALQDAVDALDLDGFALATDLAEVTADLGSVQTVSSALQATSAAHGSRLAAVEGRATTLVDDVDVLGAAVTLVEDDVDTLDSDLVTVSAAIDALSPLSAQVAAHATRLSEVDTALSMLDGDLTALEERAVVTRGNHTLLVPDDHPTIAAALDTLDGVRLEGFAFIRITQDHTEPTTIVVDHPDGERIFIKGHTGDPADVTLTSDADLLLELPRNRALGLLADLTLAGTGGSAVLGRQNSDVWLDNLVITGFGNGVWTDGGSVLANGLVLDSNHTGFRLRAASLDASAVDMTNHAFAGIYATEGSIVHGHTLTADANFVGYSLESGSILAGRTISALDSLTYGFELEGGSVLTGLTVTADENDASGFAIGSGSTLRVNGLQAIGNDSDGLIANQGSSATLWSTNTVTGNGRYGLAAWGGSFVDAGSTTPTASGSRELYALRGGYVQAPFSGVAAADASPSTTDGSALSGVLVP